MSVRKSVNYKAVKEDKIHRKKIEPERNNKVIIWVPYNQELIKKIKAVSFTTCLLESEVDLRSIQELLGRKSSKTTEIYTHISKKSLGEIASPLDKMNEGDSDEKS